MSSPELFTPQPLDYAGSDTYRERQPGWRREFILTGDRLVIRAKQFLGTRSEIPIALAGVDPVYATVWKRSDIAGPGSLFLAFIFLALLAFMVFGDGPRPTTLGFAIDGGLGLLCLITGLRHIRAVELASFGHSGGPRFEIARSGPDRDKFDAFVQRVVARVNDLRRPPISVTTSPPAQDMGGWVEIPRPSVAANETTTPPDHAPRDLTP